MSERDEDWFDAFDEEMIKEILYMGDHVQINSLVAVFTNRVEEQRDQPLTGEALESEVRLNVWASIERLMLQGRLKFDKPGSS